MTIKTYNEHFYCDKKSDKKSEACQNVFVVQYRIQGELRDKHILDHVQCPKCNCQVTKTVNFE